MYADIRTCNQYSFNLPTLKPNVSPWQYEVYVISAMITRHSS